MCLVLLYECWVSAHRTSCLQTRQFADSPLNQLFTLLAKMFTECHGQGDSRDPCYPTNKAFVFSMAQLFQGLPWRQYSLKKSPKTDDII